MITIKSKHMIGKFDEETGVWAEPQQPEEQRLLHKPGMPFEVIVDGREFLGPDRRVTDYELINRGSGCRIFFEKDGLKITHTLQLEADAPVIRQQVEIEALSGPDRKLTGVHYILPGLAVGDPAECLLQAPGQIVPPHTPYSRAASLPLDRTAGEPHPDYPQGWLESAPDQTSGLVMVQNRHTFSIASAWLYSEIATVFPTIDGDGEFITIEHRHQLCAWLRPGVKATSSGHALLLTEGTLGDHLEQFRKHCYEGTLATRPDMPAWIDDARLLQINPYPLAPWRENLDNIKSMGFNLIQLMPVWAHQGHAVYAMSDHYAISERVGTEDELKEFVAAAHERGIRVIFDLIPQGIGDSSPFIEEHPDWLVRDEQGRPFGSHGWGPEPGEPKTGHTYSLDWGNPDYRKYIVDWALWNVKTFDIDGFRTDAMHWKEANFSPGNPRPAWETTFGGIRLSEEVAQALREAKPDALLMSEVWGPIFQRSHHATYENGWLLSKVNKGWLSGKPMMTGQQYTNYKALTERARPEGLRRANFTANHDLGDVAKMALDSPLGNAVSFAHAFSAGIPFVMWGELAGREDFFRDLMEKRSRLAGFACEYDGLHCDNSNIFAALWRSQDAAYLAVANLFVQPVNATMIICPMNGKKIEINLKGGGYDLIRLEQE